MQCRIARLERYGVVVHILLRHCDVAGVTPDPERERSPEPNAGLGAYCTGLIHISELPSEYVRTVIGSQLSTGAEGVLFLAAFTVCGHQNALGLACVRRLSNTRSSCDKRHPVCRSVRLDDAISAPSKEHCSNC